MQEGATAVSSLLLAFLKQTVVVEGGEFASIEKQNSAGVAQSAIKSFSRLGVGTLVDLSLELPSESAVPSHSKKQNGQRTRSMI